MILTCLVLITIINSIMEKELKEVADMQRRRLKKVIDPMRSILALDTTGYRDYLGERVSDHAA